MRSLFQYRIPEQKGWVWFLAVLAIWTGMGLLSSALAQGDARRACLLLAVSPDDLDRPEDLPGVSFENMNFGNAQKTCLPVAQAALKQPTNSVADRLLFSATGRAFHGGSVLDALKWYQEALDRGSALAAYNAGIIYRDGTREIDPNPALSEQLLRFAWSRQLPIAGFALATAEAQENPDTVPPLMTDLVELGDERALRWMWGWHRSRNDPEGGARYIRALAHRGHSDALIALAELVGAGQIAVSNAEKSGLFRRAANAGSLLSRLYLAELLHDEGHVINATDMAYQVWDRMQAAPASSAAGNPYYLQRSAKLLTDLVDAGGAQPRNAAELDDRIRPQAGAEFHKLRVAATCGGQPQTVDLWIWSSEDRLSQTQRYITHLESYRQCRFDRNFLHRLNTAWFLSLLLDLSYKEILSTRMTEDGRWSVPPENAWSLDRPIAKEESWRKLAAADRTQTRIAVVWPNLGQPRLQDKHLRQGLAAALSDTAFGMDGLFRTEKPDKMYDWFQDSRHAIRRAYLFTEEERALLGALAVPQSIYASNLPKAMFGVIEENDATVDQYMALAGYMRDPLKGYFQNADGKELRLSILEAPEPAPHEVRAMAHISSKLGARGIGHIMIPNRTHADYDARRRSGNWDLAIEFNVTPGRFTSRFSDRLHIARVARRSAAEIEAMNGDADPRFRRSDYLGVDDSNMEALLDALAEARKVEPWDTALRAVARLSLHEIYVIPLWAWSAAQRTKEMNSNPPVGTVWQRVESRLPDRECAGWSRTSFKTRDAVYMNIRRSAGDREWTPGPEVAFDYDPATGKVRSSQNTRRAQFSRTFGRPDKSGDTDFSISVDLPLFFVDGKFSDGSVSPQLTMRITHAGRTLSSRTEEYAGRYTAVTEISALRDSLRKSNGPLAITMLHNQKRIASFHIPAAGLGRCLDEIDATIEEILR